MDDSFPSLFRLAKKEAMKSDFRIKVGAVLSFKNRPVAVGRNFKKTHPKWANPDKTFRGIHAEIDCLRQDEFNRKGDTIFVYREDKSGNPAMSRPCVNCMKELKSFGIKEIYYSIPHYPYWASERITDED